MKYLTWWCWGFCIARIINYAYDPKKNNQPTMNPEKNNQPKMKSIEEQSTYIEIYLYQQMYIYR